MTNQDQANPSLPPRDPSMTPNSIQKILDDNSAMIHKLMELQQKNLPQELPQIQQMLHKNLIYLATIADQTTISGGSGPTNQSSNNQPSLSSQFQSSVPSGPSANPQNPVPVAGVPGPLRPPLPNGTTHQYTHPVPAVPTAVTSPSGTSVSGAPPPPTQPGYPPTPTRGEASPHSFHQPPAAASSEAINPGATPSPRPAPYPPRPNEQPPPMQNYSPQRPPLEGAPPQTQPHSYHPGGHPPAGFPNYPSGGHPNQRPDMPPGANSAPLPQQGNMPPHNMPMGHYMPGNYPPPPIQSGYSSNAPPFSQGHHYSMGTGHPGPNPAMYSQAPDYQNYPTGAAYPTGNAVVPSSQPNASSDANSNASNSSDKAPQLNNQLSPINQTGPPNSNDPPTTSSPSASSS